MKAVIFLGPSLPLDQARELLDATYLPPAQQTDLMTAAVNHRPDVIGLIDGVFLQSLSVWHKEILFALDQGIHVYGASSMGALRAAETDAFGAVGIGEIYRQYASGELLDDDEVALGHAAREHGYQKTSEPMVNVRATFAAARQAGVIDEATHAVLVSSAKAIYFVERTFPAIYHAAGEHGVPAGVIAQVRRFVETGYVDLKRQDARLLLETIKQRFGGPTPPPRARCAVPFRRSTFFETLYNRDRRVDQRGQEVALDAIGNHAALHHPEFDELNFHALNRTVVYAFADLLGLEASPDTIAEETARFRKRRGLADEAALASWLVDNHVSEAELGDMMAQVALCRRMHRWFLMANWMERTTKSVLDELRLGGEYPEWAERAAAQERLLKSRSEGDDHSVLSRATMRELLDEHTEWTDRKIDIDPAVWCEEAGFHGDGNLKMELSRSSTARRVLLELLARSVPGTSGAPGAADES